jgi:hypothetical protein
MGGDESTNRGRATSFYIEWLAINGMSQLSPTFGLSLAPGTRLPLQEFDLVLQRPPHLLNFHYAPLREGEKQAAQFLDL